MLVLVSIPLDLIPLLRGPAPYPPEWQWAFRPEGPARPLLAAAATRLIDSGAAARLAAARRQEATARQAMARRWLDGPGLMRHPSAYHVWLDLPEPWRREAFVAEARRRGVAVAPAEAFAVGRQPVPHAVRICLSAARDRTRLERALGVLAEILDSEPEASPLAGPIV